MSLVLSRLRDLVLGKEISVPKPQCLISRHLKATNILARFEGRSFGRRNRATAPTTGTAGSSPAASANATIRGNSETAAGNGVK